MVCKVAVLFSLCGVGQHWFEWGCGSQAHGRQLLPGQIKSVFHAQQLQQLCRLLPRAGLPLDCPYIMDPLTCWPSALLEGEGKGSIFVSENCRYWVKIFPAKVRSLWCSALRFVGSCQLLWHLVASLYMVRVIQEDAFNTFFFPPECSPMLCHAAADKAGSVKTTCRCSVGKKRRNLFEILGIASHSFLLAQPLLQGPKCTLCRWK